MSEFCISGIPTGKLNAVVKKMMAQMSTDDPAEAVRLFNSEEWIVTKSGSGEPIIPTASTPPAWTVDDEGNIHFTLISNGMTAEQWGKYLECRGFQVEDDAYITFRRIMKEREKPTIGVTYHIVMVLGNKVIDRGFTIKDISAMADKKGWVEPHWEVACLIRDTFTREQLERMGLWYIVTMHTSVINGVDRDWCPRLLSSRRDCGGLQICTLGHKEIRIEDCGFSFVESQVCLEAKA